MAALGLRDGEVGIGASIYAGLVDFTFPAPAHNRLVFVPSYSTTFPTEDLGPASITIDGVMRLTAPNVAAFLADVAASGGERRISWLMGGHEQYGYAQAGDVTSHKCLNLLDRGVVVRVHEVGFAFALTRSQIYLAADDSVLYGEIAGAVS